MTAVPDPASAGGEHAERAATPPRPTRPSPPARGARPARPKHPFWVPVAALRRDLGSAEPIERAGPIEGLAAVSVSVPEGTPVTVARGPLLVPGRDHGCRDGRGALAR